MEIMGNPAPGFLTQGIPNSRKKTDFNPADHVLFSLFLFRYTFKHFFPAKKSANLRLTSIGILTGHLFDSRHKRAIYVQYLTS